MNNFSIESLVSDLNGTAGTENRLQAVRQLLESTVRAHGPSEIIRVLQASVPEGADVGELIVHQSDEFTILYARIPAHFRSAIHDHTVCACIAQLSGQERQVIYEETPEGGLDAVETVTLDSGELLTLRKDAIHHIENPCDETSHALHVYGGNFKAIESRRSLWSHDNHQRDGFSFPSLLKKSIDAMKDDGNREGLEALGRAIPKVREMIANPAR